MIKTPLRSPPDSVQTSDSQLVTVSCFCSHKEKWTLLGIIHLICKAASWIRSDESHPRNRCGSKRWV